MFSWRRDRKGNPDSHNTGSSDTASSDTASSDTASPDTNARDAEPRTKASRRRPSAKPGAESYGFTGLEGDFEAERRRAAEAAHEPAEPYEGEGGRPSLPGTSSGLTHP